MGEVYRADDLKLGHTVALKFLPPSLENNPRRLEYFHSEVRLTRQIGHPNVCRMYDIGELDGQHFLSMEYIDGEDLRVLLRRIGRLPSDKAIQVAQQLCAGLAVAHDMGVLHRDLKPANIMIDGRGQARITDFGLATTASEQPDAEIAGTPGYMAPEQLREGRTSVQSDLYSLGLILYEVFTGEVFDRTQSLSELTRSLEQAPSRSSHVVEEVDPAVKSVILRCLEDEPSARPPSARAIAAALPGGDALAATLAAGATPSPELVATAGEVGRLSLSFGASSLVALAVLLFVLCHVADRIRLLNLVPMDRSPESLRDEAKQILARLGVDTKVRFSAHGFLVSDAIREGYEWIDASVGRGHRFQRPKMGPWSGVQFWYRQSHRPSRANHFGTQGRVSVDRPAWTLPEMAGVWLSPQGKLCQFRRTPSVSISSLSDQTHPEPAWTEWFPEEILGFDLNDLEPARWQITPPDAFDQMRTWEGTWPDGNQPLYVVAASYRGKPVYFRILHPQEKSGLSDKTSPQSEVSSTRPGLFVFVFLLLAVQGGGALLAWWNLRMGRGDQRGAMRLSLFVFGATMVVWTLTASHPGGFYEVGSIEIAIGEALFAAATCYFSYLAVEPFVRRLRPETLFSSARVLAGQWNEPRVGRDLLAGVTVGALSKVLAEGSMLASAILRRESLDYLLPQPWALQSLEGSASLIAAIPFAACIGILWGLGILVLLLSLRLVTRQESWAAVIVILLVSLGFTLLLPGVWYVTWLAHLLNTTTLVWLVVRLGIFATTVSYFTIVMLGLPITADTSVFYFTHGLFVLLVTMGVACCGFCLSVDRRSLDFDIYTR
jgi:serine/threonine-protein kinase